MRRHLRALALATLAGLPAPGAPPAAREALLGRTIASLRFAGDVPAERPEELARLTDLNPGQRLTEPAVREALRNLFATHRFLDLLVEASPSGEAVDVVVRYEAAPVVASVRLAGKDLPARGRLRDAIGVEPGDRWSSPVAAEAARRVRSLLRERGYFAPTVDVGVTPTADDTAVDVEVRVGAGRLFRTGAPRLEGPLPEGLTAAALGGGKRAGKPYRDAAARDEAGKLSEALVRRGYGRAEVRFLGADPDPALGVATPRYSVFAGPQVRLEVSGIAESEVRRHPDSPWSRGDPPDEEALRRLRDALLETYQRRGHARASVEVTSALEPGVESIRISVVRGERYAVSSVALEGAAFLGPREFLPSLATHARGLLESGRLVDRDLAADREAIAAAYRARGFADVRVDPPRVADGKAPFTLEVTFPVLEGPRSVVASRTLEGVAALPAEELERLLVVRQGRPLLPADVESDVVAIRSAYSGQGYSDLQLSVLTVPSEPRADGTRPVAVTYRVAEGSRFEMGKTVVRGHRRTRTGVVERELAYREGDPFSFSRLVETQQRLSRLDVFSRVDFSAFPADPSTGRRTVLLTLSEAKPWSVTYGLGAEYDSGADRRFNPRLSLGLTYSNLFGRAIVVGGEARYSARESRLLFVARERNLLDWGIPLSASVYGAEEVRTGFDVRRGGLWFDTERRLGATVKATLRYQFELTEPSQDPGLDPDERQNQKNKTSSLGPGVTWDTRSDPIDPRSGSLVVSELKWAFPFLAADSDFVRLFAQGTLYRPLRGTVVVLSARAGATESWKPCDEAAGPDCEPNLTVPIVERFFAGGRTSHRAFGLDLLGIPGQTLNEAGEAYGGNGILGANLEWRVPVFGDLRAALFLDVGNVWSDWRRIRASDLRWGAGVGLSYLTPVGPLRVEYGWKLDREPQESAGEFHFSIGYPF